MTLPSSGQITLNQVNVELGLSGTAQISMNDSAVRTLFDDASGQIAMSQGYGKANAQFIAASGGSVATSGDYKIHTFTGSGTFQVTTVGNAAGSSTVEYLIVAGVWWGSGGVL